MPPLSVHISTARGVCDRLGSSLLDSERGTVYLGATAPDIRVITRWERSRTHYFHLDNFDEQNGTRGFFEENPKLANLGEVTTPTAAFVAGYVTHLVMDETWINMVYRPYFGDRSPLGGDLRAKVMDRALQFSLDYERRSDTALVADIVDAVMRCDLGLDVGFIDTDSLKQWHKVVLDMMNSAPDWDRFQNGVKRHLAGQEESEEFKELVRSAPDLAAETVEYLTPALLEEFMNEAFERSLYSVKDYLRCA